MKKDILAFVAVFALPVVVYSQGVALSSASAKRELQNVEESLNPDHSGLSLSERKERSERLVMERHGGFVNLRGTPSGKVIVVNAQDKVSRDNFDISGQKALPRIAGIVTVIDGLPATPATATKMKSDFGADFAVFIVYDKSLPPSLVAPEDKWGIMNVAALEIGAATSEIVRIRARNEFARVFAMTCGGFSSQFQSPLANYVKEISDLDNCLSDLPVDIGARIKSYLAYCGVKPAQRVTYRRACQEGWAHQPTNSFQTAVWNEVHQIPTKPITIKYDKKRGE